MNTANPKIESFKNWYSRAGHWVYDTRSEAAMTWISRGIVGRPGAPAEAASLLVDWIAADPMPALILKLRSDCIDRGVTL